LQSDAIGPAWLRSSFGMRVPRSWFALTVLAGFALAVALEIAVTIWHPPRSRVEVTTLDPRFCALSVKLLSSPNDCFYREGVGPTVCHVSLGCSVPPGECAGSLSKQEQVLTG
jgi:hypothetical protein